MAEVKMSDLNESDRRVNAASGGEIGKAKQEWNNAKAAYDNATTDAERSAASQRMTDANNRANAAREKYGGYNGGTSGTGYTPVNNSGNSFAGGYTATAYNPDGTGGKSYEQLQSEWNDYVNKWYRTGSQGVGKAWQNGYSTDMNVRSKANVIRQQMEANEKAMATADKKYKGVLDAENTALAGMLGGTTTYNDTLGRWETWNPNVGYGYNLNSTNPGTRNAWKQYYGYTDEEIDNWANDTSHYYNFVDVMAPARNTIDESSGFTGMYAQFVNGPYIPGTHYTAMTDVYGDNFGNEGTFVSTPQYDENGNIIKTAPALKGNNNASPYLQQFLPVATNGVLTGHGPAVSAMDSNSGNNNTEGQRNYYNMTGGVANTPVRQSAYGNSGGSQSGYLAQMYDAALKSQLAQLEASYNQNLSDLDASAAKTSDSYTEQKRQTTGTSAQDAAAWREMANAYGLNTGAVGQAALAQNNQLQSNLNNLESAEASALAEIERQRTLLGQEYQLQINQAIADNDFQRAQALYNEAVRAEEQLMQQQQYASQLALQYAQMAQDQYQYENDLAMKYAKAGLSITGAPTTDNQYISATEPNRSTGYVTGTINSVDELTPEAKTYLNNLSRMYGNGRVTQNGLADRILKANDAGTLTDTDAEFLMRYYGFDSSLWFE